MRTEEAIELAARQLADFRQVDALSHILDDYALLIEEHRQLKSDYEEERSSREKYKQVVKNQERNPFALVLVDGDGYVFNDSLVAKGGDGGGKAAQMLNEAIRASLRAKDLGECEVMIRVYANVTGLSRALSRAGMAGAKKRSLGPFIASFNRSYGLTDFVDAGELKENADFKLRALLQLYAQNTQCKHIYFAACHDVGYVADLTPYTGNSKRFTLINAPSIHFHDEFARLGMGVEKLPGVFMANPLDSSPSYRASRPAASPNKAAALPSSSSSSAAAASAGLPHAVVAGSTPRSKAHEQTVCRFNASGRCRFGQSCQNLHLDCDRPQKALGSDGRTNVGGTLPGTASRARSGATEQMSGSYRDSSSHSTSNLNGLGVVLLPSKGSVPAGHVAVNAHNFRLDPWIPASHPDVVARFMLRIRRRRVCNNFHLNGSCDAGEYCPYDHGELDAESKRVLESLARTMPCSKRGRCRTESCTLGHICQNVKCQHRGGKSHCRLPQSSHTEDLAVASYVLADRAPHSWLGMPDLVSTPEYSDEEDDDDEEEEEEEQEEEGYDV